MVTSNIQFYKKCNMKSIYKQYKVLQNAIWKYLQAICYCSVATPDINISFKIVLKIIDNFSEILIEINTFSFKKCIWKCCLQNDVYLISASELMHKKLIPVDTIQQLSINFSWYQHVSFLQVISSVPWETTKLSVYISRIPWLTVLLWSSLWWNNNNYSLVCSH